jgi:hypothetical protein
MIFTTTYAIFSKLLPSYLLKFTASGVSDCGSIENYHCKILENFVECNILVKLANRCVSQKEDWIGQDSA